MRIEAAYVEYEDD